MRGAPLALTGCLVLMIAAFAGPVLAEDSASPSPAAVADETRSAEPSSSHTPSAQPSPSGDCASLKESIQAKIDAFVEHQRSVYAAFVAGQEADHKAFHETNVSDADEKAFHDRQAQDYAANKKALSDELDWFTADAWGAYRQRCESHAGDRPMPTASNLPAECREKWDTLQSVLERMREKWEARHKEFQAHYDAARAEFRSGEHSDADWKAFEEKWSTEARGLYQAMDADLKAAADHEGLLKCWLVVQGDAAKPVPTYAEKRAKDVPMDEGAKRLMQRCQARMDELLSQYKARDGSTTVGRYEGERDGLVSPSKSPAAAEPATRPAPTYNDGDAAALRERMMKLKSECEAEMKAYLEKKHAEKKGDFGSFLMREEDGKIVVEGKYLSMVGLPERQMLTEIALNKKVLIDALYANGYLAEFRPEQSEEGSALVVLDAAGNQILRVHDNPRGVIKLSTSSEIESLSLDLNDNLELTQDSEGIRFAYGEWKGALLVHKGSVEMADGNVLTVHGKATFLVTNVYREKERLGDKYQDAVLHKKVGAEISVGKDGTSDATPLGDLDVKETTLVGSKLSARFDSADGEGKTVVFKVESGLFACDGLRVKLYAVGDEGAESTLEIREADNLEDVLDPADDGPDGFEYWCVSDKDGQQILVSIAHFSEKRVEFESAAIEDALRLVPGFEATILVAASGCALVLAGLRRRL
jgi:hypothetical protein